MRDDSAEKLRCHLTYNGVVAPTPFTRTGTPPNGFGGTDGHEPHRGTSGCSHPRPLGKVRRTPSQDEGEARLVVATSARR
jgi:hypothetical protein